MDKVYPVYNHIEKVIYINNIENLLAEAQQLDIFCPLDLHFAKIITNYENSALMLACTCLSASVRSGHTCLPLSTLTPKYIFNGCFLILADQIWELIGNPSIEDWYQLLIASSAISNGSIATPLVLDNKNLYLQRMWKYEQIVASYFNKPKKPIKQDRENIKKLLNCYFPIKEETVDWQKIAVATAIISPLTLICGSPGTGKTSIIAKILAILIQLNSNLLKPRLMMAAPTGKAAARLSESLLLEIQNLRLSKEHEQLIPKKAITIHHLLGSQPNKQKTIYHSNNMLHIDILIIDEASMISLPMMANLILALPPNVKLIFIGDICQLASVEAGSVFSDICQSIKIDYSLKRHEELEYITEYIIPKKQLIKHYSIIQDNKNIITSSLCLLNKNYRFSSKSIIHRLANAINMGDVTNALLLLVKNNRTNLSYKKLYNNLEYSIMINDCINKYKDYLILVRNRAAPITILNIFNRFRILCALREGKYGVNGVNNLIEQLLKFSGFIKFNNNKCNYAGQPIIITRNAPELDLYNGNIGIILKNNKSILRAYFYLQNELKDISIDRLPEYETSFAMTVHKSQGSEFYHTKLILPDKISPILTRELLYTAVTRAKVFLSIYSTDEILKYTILNKTIRYSGLITKLKTVIY